MPAHLSDARKTEALRALAEHRTTARKLAQELGIDPGTIYRYRRELMQAGLPAMLAGIEGGPAAAPDAAPPVTDPPEERHDSDFWRRKARELERQLDERQAVLAKVACLQGLRIRAPSWPQQATSEGDSRATLVVHTSDWHIGEVVQPAEINGWNGFDLDAARARVGRLMEAATELGPRWAAGARIDGVLLTMGGDAISGDIHEELSRTNEVESLPAVTAAAGLYASCVARLAETFGRVHVAAVPGNHGRTTKKPSAKRYGALSYDIFIARLVAEQFADDPRVSFEIADGPDVLTVIYGWPILLSHGDRIGTGGGQGFAGPVLPIIRGGHKMRLQYSGAGVRPHLMLLGHYHTSANPPGILANGSLVGLSEFGFGLRGAWETPRQWLAMIRPAWGLAERLDVQLERPPRPEKPRLRAIV